MVFLVQFGINLHEWVLKNSQVQIRYKLDEKTVWLLISNTNVKKFLWRKCRKIFLEAIFSKFPYNILVIVLHDIFGLEISYCLSANYNSK